MLTMRAVGMQVMHLLSKPYECTSPLITTNFNFCQWTGWVAAVLSDRRLQGDEFEAVDVADGSSRDSGLADLNARKRSLFEVRHGS